MASRLDKEKIKNKLASILEIIHSEADPAVLNGYRKIIKKEVSFFRRSWLSAWLLMAYDKNGLSGSKIPRPEICPLTGDETKRLFINIGKNRRVYPREISALIMAKASVSRDDIGAIRILESYSFVEVRDTRAQQVIDALDGLMFRGRTLVVNYAKNKKEESGGVGENSDGNAPQQQEDYPDKEDV